MTKPSETISLSEYCRALFKRPESSICAASVLTGATLVAMSGYGMNVSNMKPVALGFLATGCALSLLGAYATQVLAKRAVAENRQAARQIRQLRP